MNQSKFSLADVLTVVASILFGIVSFLGADFLNINNSKVWGMSHTTGCLVMAIVIALLLGGTALGAKILKRTSRNFKTCFVWEIVCLVFFILFAVFFASKASPFPHFFAVYSHKTEIKNKLQTSITQAENMFAEYETYADNRENRYRENLKSIVATKDINPQEYAEFGFVNGVSDASQIDTKMFTIHADLFPTHYSDSIANNGIKEVATLWLKDAKGTTNSRHFPIGSTNIVTDIEQESNKWLNILLTLSQERGQGEQAKDFIYSLRFEDVKTYYSKIVSPSWIAILCAILAYLLMLLPWVFSLRHSKKHKKYEANDTDIE